MELSAGGRRFRGVTRDLSVGGLGLARAGGQLEPGQRFTAEFPLPGIDLPVELKATVVWRAALGEGAGLRFAGVHAGVAELISRHASGDLRD